MKLSVNLDGLWQRVREMGAATVSFDSGAIWNPAVRDIDAELSSSKGVEIPLEDVTGSEGVIIWEGRQVVLFIPDHSSRVREALENGGIGNKFHIAQCSMLDKMKQRNRFERYKVTNNLGGLFEIYGHDERRREVSGETRLHVCKLCLNYLNYQGAANGNAAQRNQIVHNFDMGKFFSTYSSVFRHMPKQTHASHQKGYTRDWPEISAKFRQSLNYTCQRCKVQLQSNKHLLHAHHANGVKHDNSEGNLIAVCADCHRKEAMHDHMFVKHEDTQTINRLRREQGIIQDGFLDWASVIRLADPALHGILKHARLKGYSPPEIGFKLTTTTGQVAELELAWPHKRFGIRIGTLVEQDGWRILGLKEALDFFARRS